MKLCIGGRKEISQLRLMLENKCGLHFINKRGLPTKEIPILAWRRSTKW